ncbi:hypothetical protein [Methylobacterium aerolatum]|uniref:Uncharacterized protein n=1 Tax=Methylobacterium aerolatum TaxID=418708 RepID=A0ABU0I8C3_9HYPH|nr:hypothetical protein [Methylobacterium aerolatum]MDQ0449894.1 hypothetical protein [Methylobacterium aerolatum]GJD37429.1 hypothetical protein FMGBMHLM_4360 [Methylobacterium aerolatum]
MIATALSAFVLFAAVQCLLVVHVADKLSPTASDDRTSAKTPAGTKPQYA